MVAETKISEYRLDNLASWSESGLAMVDDKILAAANATVVSARATASEAKLTLQRAKAMQAEGLSAAQDYEAAEANQKRAQAQVLSSSSQVGNGLWAVNATFAEAAAASRGGDPNRGGGVAGGVAGGASGGGGAF